MIFCGESAQERVLHDRQRRNNLQKPETHNSLQCARAAEEFMRRALVFSASGRNKYVLLVNPFYTSRRKMDEHLNVAGKMCEIVS